MLSAAAMRRRQEALPELLGAVRWRRRRRLAARGAAVLLLVLSAASPWWWRAADGAGGALAPAVADGPPWTVLGDDPSVLARCEVPTRVDPAWFVDDQQLQRLLLDGNRPDGLVRAGSRVIVAAAAIDPWPGDAP